jgi:hypothetical protein
MKRSVNVPSVMVPDLKRNRQYLGVSWTESSEHEREVEFSRLYKN